MYHDNWFFEIHFKSNDDKLKQLQGQAELVTGLKTMTYKGGLEGTGGLCLEKKKILEILHMISKKINDCLRLGKSALVLVRM